jgi:hypothetical protein
MIGLRAISSMNQGLAGTKERAAASTQMQLLQLQPGNNADCLHGFIDPDESLKVFVDAFINAYEDSSSQLVGARMVDGINATAEKFAKEVWESSNAMESIVSYFVDKGAKAILDGDNETARRYAVFASYFERCIVVEDATRVAHRKSDMRRDEELHNLKAQLSRSWAKVGQVFSDEHSLVSYYRNRVSCSCLDNKFKEVKYSKKKAGICFNPMCRIPCYLVQHSATTSCSQCQQTIYCSKECQIVHWPLHSKICYEVAVLRTAFIPISSTQDDQKASPLL